MKFFACLFIAFIGLIFTPRHSLAQRTNPPQNIVYVNTLADLPAAVNNTITLKPDKVYQVAGMVEIYQYKIDLNGAGLVGTDPSKDGFISSAKGAVITSLNKDVFMEKIAIIPMSAETSAYDLVDDTGTKFLNFLGGNSVIEVPRIASQGVGKITGFNSIYITSNYWKCSKGLEVGGSTGKFCGSFNYITGITKGAGIEFLPGLNISDVDISNNYFVFSGQTAMKINEQVKVENGRMSNNLFRGPTNFLLGFDSYTPGWEMRGNGVGVPDTKPYAYTYMNGNTFPTKFIAQTLYTKIEGKTTSNKANGFIHDNNKFTYTGKRTISTKVYANIGGVNPEDNSEFSIAIFKNGKEQIAPSANISVLKKGEGFQLFLETEVDLEQNDFIEIFIKNNFTTAPITIRDLQFRVSV